MFFQKSPAIPSVCRAFLGMVLLLIACCLMTQAAFAASHTLPPPLIETVCKDTVIQPGWVIVDVLTDQHRCEGGLLTTDNVWAITKATGPTHVCSNSPIPQGFVVTAEGNAIQRCDGVGLPWNLMTLTPVAGLSTVTICASSPIPSGFVVTGEDRLLDRLQVGTTCPADAAAAATIITLNTSVQKTLRPVTDAVMQICADSPVPNGYRIVQRTILLAPCHIDQGSSLLIEPIPASHWSV